ncbi:hypothetical protein G6F58_013028 [Rhizopus delemar]|nr:hypothetical protein G6F58_013028 [Rhizopus delemar]
MVSVVWRLAQQRHAAAITGTHAEAGQGFRAALLGTGEAHPHRHLVVAAAELAHRCATQRQADEAGHLLGIEAERRGTLAIDANLQFAALLAVVDAHVAHIERESPTSCTCTPWWPPPPPSPPWLPTK